MTDTQSKQPRLLIVEDDKLVCESLKALLSRLPARCEDVQSGDEAVESVLRGSSEGDPFRLIVLDVWVPKKSGGEVEQSLAMLFLERNRTFRFIPPDVPVVVFTSHESYADCVRCLKAGAFDYLPKVEEGRNNMQVLFERCRELLNPPRRPDPFFAWVRTHREELQKLFSGRVCAAFDPEVAQRSSVVMQRVGDYAVVAASSDAELGRILVRDRELRWETPQVVNLR
jgi:DNA-binding response OmpR family regulator